MPKKKRGNGSTAADKKHQAEYVAVKTVVVAENRQSAVGRRGTVNIYKGDTASERDNEA